MEDLPAHSFITLADIVVKGEVDGAINGDLVAIVNIDQFAQLLSARKRSGFHGHAFLRTAVPMQDKGVVVHNGEAGPVKFSREMGLCQSHTDTHSYTLAQRTGASVYTRRNNYFWVAGGF